ncbi:MAG: DUF86 domain-containing protein [Gracilibacteraceae bacterium]|nr:DUF86 domain-containing protein [Gracilibacteraceae bacterium]
MTVKVKLKYCRESVKYISNATYDQFMKDERTVVFSVFNLSQAGQLVDRLSTRLLEKNSHIQWRAIKGFRNRLIHEYEEIDYMICWDVLN